MGEWKEVVAKDGTRYWCFEEGEQNQAIETARKRKMKAKGYAAAEIAELTGLVPG